MLAREAEQDLHLDDGMSDAGVVTGTFACVRWSAIRYGAVASVIGMLAVVPGARAAITILPGATTVATQRVAFDFGDGGGNVERLDSVRWSGTNGAFGANLV